MKRFRTALLLLAALALVAAATAQARGRHGTGHQAMERDPGAFVAEHAERLGLDEATVASIQAAVEATRDENQGLRRQLREGHRELRAMLEADAPEEAALLAKAAELGAVETELHQARLRALLQVRGLLTPEQRAALRELREERARHHRHGKGETCERCREKREGAG